MTEELKETPWYAEEGGFFGRDYLQEYTDIITPERTEKEVNFIEKTICLKKGMKILDLCCGHGRHTLALAQRGYQMIGQDINSFFLEKAHQAADRAQVKVRWVKSDMRQIPFKGEFDVILNLFTAFGYFENDKEDEKVLYEVAKALRFGGKFFLDTINRDRIMREFRDKDWRELRDGSVVFYERKFDFIAGRQHERRLRIWENGERKEFKPNVRMYTLPELVAMCQKAGLRYQQTYGDYTGEEVSLSSKRYILITEKGDH